MKAIIPYGRQYIDESDIQAVIETLQSDYITQGPAVPLFERAVAGYCGAQYGVAVNSATSALHIACLSLGLKSGDILWTSPITFVSSANCGIFCGAQVDFVDIDYKTYNMSVDCLTEKLARADKEGRLPKIVIPVHLCGQSCDMATIYALSQRYGFSIIEDASHAIGGEYRQEPIGNCRYSDITVFSFHPVKIITTGEGGMAVTNNAVLAEKMALLRSHGITRDPQKMSQIPDGSWYYEQVGLGYNYRMTDIQAALGISQIKKIDRFVAKRDRLALSYNMLLDDLPLNTPWIRPSVKSAWHLYVIRLKLDQINLTRKSIFESLKNRKIGVNIHYIPVHTQPYYLSKGFGIGQFPEAEKYYDEAITLPLFPTLSNDQQYYVVSSLKEILQK